MSINNLKKKRLKFKNIMAVLDTIITRTIEYCVEKTFEKGANLFTKINQEGTVSIEKSDLPKIFENHYTEVINWSSDIPFIGLSISKRVSKYTIELLISSKISKYDKNQIKKNETNFFSELDILNSDSHILILGKPGAGKTTTVKRLISRFFSTDNEKIPYTNPILLRLRDVKETGNIYTEILDIFSIPWEVKEFKNTKKVRKADGSYYDEEISVFKTIVKNSEKTVDTFVPNFLNVTNSILFLDGYDELPESIQKKVLTDIEKLGLRLNNAKVILTSRTSSFFKIISNFSIYEINPLSYEDIREISFKWLVNGNDFLKELNRRKYVDLANRPIFLTLLLILFEKNKILPLSPFEVYREAVFLIIRDWDDHRGINRVSKYANFDVRKKLDFLQEVSLYLTYQIKSNLFSSDELKDVYKLLHRKYDLPAEDMLNVIHEIESHNGLISEVGFNSFEFSHLSLQEYLCAECLITLPYSKNTIVYFFERPDPLAIAVCISKDSGLWLANLLLNSNLNVQNFTDKQRFEKSLLKFLSRLIDERPRFGESIELGLVMIYLISKFQNSKVIFDLIINLLHIDNVKEALEGTLKYYSIKKKPIEKQCFLNRTTALNVNSFIEMPYKEYISLDKWEIVESILQTIYSSPKIDA